MDKTGVEENNMVVEKICEPIEIKIEKSSNVIEKKCQTQIGIQRRQIVNNNNNKFIDLGQVNHCEENDGNSHRINSSDSFSNATNGDNIHANSGTSDTSSNGLDRKSNKIKHIVETSISLESKETVQQILDQVNQLSTPEKLLLYLKLPTGKSSNVDPLRQPLNPLGSRFEIHQTITWIKTHLEENQDVSLPKQDVYDEYLAYCNSNEMKPLSTADFGKVMKQVFPSVRPRRLGTRGNSRYCYSGMKKRVALDAPLLPDLSQDVKPPHCSEDELLASASHLIRQWAEKLLGTRFDSLQHLACHLVDNLCVDSRSVAAFTLLSTGKGVAGTSPLVIPSTPPGGPATKHRETQLQLQRKLQERVVIKEQKRKLQDQQQGTTGTVTPKPNGSERPRAKRVKLPNGAAKERSRSVQPAQAATNRDPKPPLSRSLSTPGGAQPDCDTPLQSSPSSTKPPPEKKLPIPRLPKTNGSITNVIILPPQQPARPRGKKYKVIQPKPGSRRAEEPAGDPSLEKNALDGYLHEENSQEQEEELMQYFNGPPSDEPIPDQAQVSKLSQLRLLLERNLNQAPVVPPAVEEPGDVFLPGTSASASLCLLSQRSRSRAAEGRRRVSFETGVPPSPNTRRRIFSFTPISPGPHSPVAPAPQPRASSPFVSPRNTPAPRARASHRSNSVNVPSLFAVPDLVQHVSQSAPQSPRIRPYPPSSLNAIPETRHFFPEDSMEATGSLYRSQSVPLHRMASLYPGQALTFSNPPPPEYPDFQEPPTTLELDGEVVPEGLNPENLNRIFKLLDDAEEQTLGLAAEDPQCRLLQPSHSYPNTPLPYRSVRDPVVTSFVPAGSVEEAAMMSRSYPSTPLLSLPLFGEENLTLNARRNINSLLDQQQVFSDDPFQPTLDTLEGLQDCDTFGPLVGENGGV